MEKITLCPLPHLFSVCQVQEAGSLPMGREYCFTACTKDEISLVCKTEDVPSITLQREDGWRCFYVQGVLDFSLIGILARISSLLAEAGISIFALSTFNTDYLLVKQTHWADALDVLANNGYVIEQQ